MIVFLKRPDKIFAVNTLLCNFDFNLLRTSRIVLLLFLLDLKKEVKFSSHLFFTSCDPHLALLSLTQTTELIWFYSPTTKLTQ